MKRWTDKEIEYLQDKAGNVSMRYLSETLNRTPGAIINKLTKSGIGCPTVTTDYLLVNIAAKMIGIDYKRIKYWIKYKGLKIEQKAIRGKNKRILIDYNTFIEFLKNNQKLWDSRKVDFYSLGCEPKWLEEKRKLDRLLPRNKEKKWTIHEDVEAEGMKAKGYKIQEIANRLNRTYASVKRRLYDIRQSKGIGTISKVKSIILLDEYGNIKETFNGTRQAGKHLNISRQTVSDYCNNKVKKKMCNIVWADDLE